MARYLILYNTSDDHTSEIAEHIATVLNGNEQRVTLMASTALADDVALDKYDVALIGAAPLAECDQRAMQAFVTRNRARLAQMASAVFSVDPTTAHSPRTDRHRMQAHLNQFFAETDWHPQQVATFAEVDGRPQHRRMTSDVAGDVSVAPDATPERESVDWEAVTRFAESLVMVGMR